MDPVEIFLPLLLFFMLWTGFMLYIGAGAGRTRLRRELKEAHNRELVTYAISKAVFHECGAPWGTWTLKKIEYVDDNTDKVAATVDGQYRRCLGCGYLESKQLD